MMSRLRYKVSPLVQRIRGARRRRYLRWLYDYQRKNFYSQGQRKYTDSDLTVSILVPAFNPKPVFFEHLLSSVFSQSYQNWELVIADGSTIKSIQKFIENKAQSDDRIKYIKVENGGIAANTNAAIQAASGEILAFLDHDDSLDPDALAYGVEQFEKFPDTGLVYSDEDKITEDGSRYLDPHYKPDFSLDLLRNVNYITHLVMVRKDIAKKIDGIRGDYEGAQDYDFLLRVIDTGIKVRHVPRILYHWRLSESSTAADFSNKAHITNAGEKALRDHFERRGVEGVEVKAIAGRPGFYRAIYEVSKAKRAILLDLPTLTPNSVTEFIKKKFKENSSVAGNHIAIVEYTEGLDLSDYSSVMLIRDVAIPAHKGTQIAQMFAVVEQPDVFAVSPKLVAGGMIADMGLVKNEGDSLVPLFQGMDPNDLNVFGSVEWVRNVNALSGPVLVLSGADINDHMRDPKRVLRSPNLENRRLLVWSHTQMVGLTGSSVLGESPKVQDAYFNTNLTANYFPVVRQTLNVSTLMKEQLDEEDSK